MEESEAGILTNAERLKLRSVPIFPLKSKHRTQSADSYASVKPTVQSTVNINYRPGGGTTDILTYRTPNYKTTTKSRIITSHRPRSRDSSFGGSGTKKQSRNIPIRRPIEIHNNTAARYGHIKHKIDDKDPTPSIRNCTHSIDQLVEQEGFLINPRFRDIAKSKSFDSVGKLMQCLNKEL